MKPMRSCDARRALGKRRLGLAQCGVPRSPRSQSSSALPPLRPVASNLGPVKRTSRRVTDIDLEAFLNGGRRNSRRQALLRPIGVVLDTPGLNGLKALGASDEEDPQSEQDD